MKLYDLEWQPPHILGDPVIWMRRVHNKVADGLADFAMDKQVSWEKRYVITKPPHKSNLCIYSNGGRRSSTCASSAFVVGLVMKMEDTILYYKTIKLDPGQLKAIQFSPIARTNLRSWHSET